MPSDLPLVDQKHERDVTALRGNILVTLRTLVGKDGYATAYTTIVDAVTTHLATTQLSPTAQEQAINLIKTTLDETYDRGIQTNYALAQLAEHHTDTFKEPLQKLRNLYAPDKDFDQSRLAEVAGVGRPIPTELDLK